MFSLDFMLPYLLGVLSVTVGILLERASHKANTANLIKELGNSVPKPTMDKLIEAIPVLQSIADVALPVARPITSAVANLITTELKLEETKLEKETTNKG